MSAPARIPVQPWMAASDATRILEALGAGDVDVRFVGGCVRDAVLGRTVKDVDIATPERPDDVIARLEGAGVKVIPTGIEHGTVTAVVEHRPFEITTLRRDVETFGRHARVEFTDDWRADAARRDFTMNAMSSRPDGTLFDYHGGWEDLAAGQVRFVGDPATRIEEDFLRILRFYRFVAHYGRGEPHGPARAACRAHAPAMSGLSGERLREETFRLLIAPNPEPVVGMMREDGVLNAYLIGSADAAQLPILAALTKIEDVLSAPSAIRRFAALLDPDTNVDTLADRLKFSNADRERLANLVAGMEDFAPAPTPTALRKRLYEVGALRYEDMLLLDAAKRHVHGSELLQTVETIRAYRKPKLPIGGNDVQALGVEKGAEVGRLLRTVERWWIEEDFAPDRAASLAKLGSLVDN